MNEFFKIFRISGSLFICLILFSTTAYGNWLGIFTPALKKAKRGDEYDFERFSRERQLELFSDDDYATAELRFILERAGIRNDLPEEMFERLKSARKNPSELFCLKSFGLNLNRSAHRHTNLFMFHLSELSRYGSAIDVLQSDDIYRIFFFSLFDPSDVRHINGLFVGLRVHGFPHYEEIGFDEINEIANHVQTTGIWEEWVFV